MGYLKGISNLKEVFGRRFCPDLPLAPLTSLKIGGNAEFWLLVENLSELELIIDFVKKKENRR